MTDPPGQTLSHYRLIEKIGEGGMGVVWKAEDRVLHRTVAIKVLPADRARDDERRRMFLDEARRASSVNDMHIVQVYEVGREGDLDFIVMEYVDGKPLSRLLHHRPLAPEMVASLGLQVAKALARAHRKGLLHRDLKPANILVTPDGDAKVVDFGLATLFTPAESMAGTEASTVSALGGPEGGAGSRGRTARMPLAGTLPYMSPEQARGENLDARSDIFSLGSVLYEMSTGRRPFVGPTSVDVLQAILRARPATIHEQVPNVPIELERIVQKALAGHRAERYQSMEDMAVDLKRLGRDLESGSSPSYDALREPLARAQRRRMALMALAGGLALVAAGLGVWVATPRVRSLFGAPAVDSRTILILPLEIRGQSEGAEYIGRAFAETIAVSLATAMDLRVLPVPAAGPPASANPLASARTALDLGAGRLLTGSLTREAKAVHASLSLVDSRENRILWGTRRDGDDERIPDMAASLAREIALQFGAMLPKEYNIPLTSLGGRAMASSPLTTEALAALQSDQAAAALEATKRLVETFPDEPDARYLRAEALFKTWDIERSGPGRKALEEGLADLIRADPKHPAVEVMHAYLISGDGRVPEAIAQFTRVLARQDLAPPLRAQVLTYRGWNRSQAGEHPAALADFEEALRLSPAIAGAYRALADALRFTGRLEEALVRARQAVALSPLNSLILLTLNWTLVDLGRPAEAVPYAARACELAHNGVSCASYATTLYRAGRNEEALEAARRTENLPEDPGGRYNLACFWAVAGRPNEALRNLRRAVAIGYVVAFIERDPDLTSLHGHPEFEAIVAEIRRRLGDEHPDG